ncbi:MAG: NAD-dependent protein deacylase [Deltaproteobacteria bacterium]|jgi:NAD-dependent deacetylase|nr:NAD-dependent protein deacylase [Deltaproteobacteria bacterium]MBW2531734.1 NAD-dependent protein deacylase [Deltaproteobacteria bacterium]
MDDARDAAGKLRTLWDDAAHVVAFTGAGASAASGVPTYRGAGGSWTRYDPNRYASIDYFRQDPTYYFRFFRDERYPTLIDASPNPVHHTLAALERAGKLAAVVTQNIDGLHRAAGSKRVLELHGNTRQFCCEACGEMQDFQVVRSRIDEAIPPECPACGQPALRPDVVLFGEALPVDVLDAAAEEMDQADLVVVVGSSLVVHPAASLPLAAVRRGAKLAILNIDPTPLDGEADLLVATPADRVLPRLLDDE